MLDVSSKCFLPEKQEHTPRPNLQRNPWTIQQFIGCMGFISVVGFQGVGLLEFIGFIGSWGLSHRRGTCDGNFIGATTGLQGLPAQNSQQARRRTCFNCGRRVRAESKVKDLHVLLQRSSLKRAMWSWGSLTSQASELNPRSGCAGFEPHPFSKILAGCIPTAPCFSDVPMLR